MTAHAVVLAAGAASRLGRPKAVLEWRGRPLLQHVLDAVAASQAAGGVLVLGHAADAVRAAISVPPDVTVATNPAPEQGQASSLRTGLRSLGAGADAVVVLLGDQPTVDPAAIDAVIDRWRRGAEPIVRARYADGAGHPVLFDRSVWSELERLDGDTGARPLLERHPELVADAPVDGTVPPDVDTWDDYRALLGETRPPDQ